MKNRLLLYNLYNYVATEGYIRNIFYFIYFFLRRRNIIFSINNKKNLHSSALRSIRVISVPIPHHQSSICFRNQSNVIFNPAEILICGS